MRHWILGTTCLAACIGCAPQSETSPDTQISTPTSAADITRTPVKTAYFGDLHVHTTNSFDAFIFGTTTDADDAYRFAKGETIDNGAGDNISLSGPPLDFYAVTDHGEYLGVVPAMRDRSSPLSKTETAKSIFGVLATDRRANFLRIGQTVVSGEPLDDIYDRQHMDSVWARTKASAARHNAPGTFTTFAGYEFTSMRLVSDGAAANLHRNVIFEDVAPGRLFTTLDSPNPEDLWDWMDGQRNDGHDVLSIPHNSNASNGMMFSGVAYDGSPLTKKRLDARARNEPLVEITQLKGTSETHPALSPNDEYSNFEIYDYLIGATDKSTPLNGSFVRQALARGLGIETELGVNPYEFGVIGSSDTHISGGPFQEESFFGKFPHDMKADNRQSTPPNDAKTWPADYTPPTDLIATPQYGASGLAGVWAEANTREDLFASLQARETFGTSGPRMKVRFFAFADTVEADLLAAPNMVEQAYAAGVPMGQSIASEAPSFLAWAMRDAQSAPLERLQIVKTWTQDGALKETITDVACATGEPVNGRCAAQNLSVDVKTCEQSGTGAGELKAIWSDTNGAATQNAAYYVRVLEAPKCRWSTWDAVRKDVAPSPILKTTVQDRAWSSAIWTE